LPQEAQAQFIAHSELCAKGSGAYLARRPARRFAIDVPIRTLSMPFIIQIDCPASGGSGAVPGKTSRMMSQIPFRREKSAKIVYIRRTTPKGGGCAANDGECAKEIQWISNPAGRHSFEAGLTMWNKKARGRGTACTKRASA
jgi:hypothetical protein